MEEITGNRTTANAMEAIAARNDIAAELALDTVSCVPGHRRIALEPGHRRVLALEQQRAPEAMRAATRSFTTSVWP
jgi:hypothetical protein